MSISIIQRSFTGGEWSPSLYGRTDLDVYPTAARLVKNFIPHVHGGVSNRGGLRYLDDAYSSSHASILIPFTFSVVQKYFLEFSNYKMRILMDGGLVRDDVTDDIVEIDTPYSSDDLALLTFTQSADVMYLFHPSFQERKLTRSAHDSWNLVALTYTASISAPTELTRSVGSGTDYNYVVTAVTEDGEESVASSAAAADPGDTLTWEAGTAAKYYNIYKDGNQGGTYGWIGQSDSKTFTEPSGGITPDYTTVPPVLENPFDGSGRYPAVGEFYKQRLLRARSNQKPDTVFASAIGSFENMNRSYPRRPDEAWSITLNAKQVNEVRWMVPLSDLIIGTTGGEWRMYTPAGDETGIPAVERQSNWGSHTLAPVVIGSSILFVDITSNTVRDLAYSFEVDHYDSDDLTLMARHLFDRKEIVSWAFQQNPEPILWVVFDDGTLSGLTYYKKQRVWGWHQHTTEGYFESVACQPSGDSTSDMVYFVVRRTINGSTVRYIEQLDPGMSTGDIEDAFFVDSGLSYSGEATDTFSGLDHLEGETVVAFADGVVLSGLVVSSGSVTLPVTASTVHIGLSYTSDLETLDFEPVGSSETLQDKYRSIDSVVVRLKDSRAFWAGPDEDHLNEAPVRTDEAYGEAVPLLNGDVELLLEPNEADVARLYVRNSDPVPLTILSVCVRMSFEDMDG